MKDKYVTLRIWKETMRQLRFLSGEGEETMVSVVARIIEAEYNRVRQTIVKEILESEKRDGR